MKLKFLLLVIYLSVFGGAIGVFAKVALPAFSPMVMIFYRVLISVVIFTAVFIYQKKLLSAFKVIFRHWGKFIILSLSCVGLAMVVGFLGLRYTTAINYGLIYNLSPIFIIFFARLLLKEKMGRFDPIFILMAFLGVAVIVTNGKFAINILEPHFFGDFLVLISALGWALYSVLGTRFSRVASEFDSLTINFGSLLIGVIFLSPIVFFGMPDGGITMSALSIKTVLNLLGLAVLSTAFLFFLWFKFIKEKGGTWASLVAFSENLSGVLLPVIFLGEKLTPAVLTGGALIVLAVVGKELFDRKPTA
ncbi:MAG: hypothetical protein COU29_03655 [Candidatus Magasanikbacteria bacterium CG10_big_fil_rev_8_21_14_0_10_36_32]|uniref:EamA domain-containing protein n=1 Tax=Candidatus Magasanikbacteria bacterium CG10_big_fil_rev_8_21_14_0_10_36_32 TaxID=1974646 RepID=A0A2M6W5M2_9BACT|nr:MAG: hypothetical protein COU29_03655 [Candidatus Magasanikbacteria bacterium CG10_big_fil_rev_8_21_14_0_10_36_32]